MSCGIVVNFAVVALRAAGSEAAVEVLPAPADPDHLATIRATGPREATDADRALAETIGRRHTVRTAFERRAGPTEVIGRLQAAAGAYGLWAKEITRSEEEVATVFLLSQAEELEQREPDYVKELESWMRTDPSAVDGVPVEAVPAGDPRDRPSNWLFPGLPPRAPGAQPFPGGRRPAAPPP